MARIKAPNESYAGISAGVVFENGIGSTDNPYLIEWFKAHGYMVEDLGSGAKEGTRQKRSRRKEA